MLKPLARFSLCIMLGLCGPTSAFAADAKTVTIALEGSFPPWNFTEAEGSLGGFEPALAKVLCERAKLDCKLITAEWNSMIPALNAEKFDVIMDAMNITPERKKAIGFTIPYAAVQSRFASNAANAPAYADLGSGVVTINAGEDPAPYLDKFRALLKGKVIGVQTATNYVPFVRANFASIAEIREYKTAQERDLDLQNGRIDLTIDNTIYLLGVIKSSQGALNFVGPAIGGTIWGEGVALGLRKSDGDLRSKFSEAIQSTKTDGTIAKLSKQFLDTDVTPP